MAYGLKYFINYYQGNQLKSCELHQRDYTGPSTLLKHTSHPVEISYIEGPKYETFKSSKAVISLLAGNGFTASELYTEDEREWLVICKHNGGQVFWKGFVLPDGCEEDFTSSENYVVQVNAVDGLGLLKNLKFVREDGNIWVGKMTPKDIIWNCLNRLQIPGMALHTLVEVYEESMSETGDPLTQSLLQLETYFLSDATTPMNCQEVLESVLNTVGGGAQIIQSEGEWYVFQMDALVPAGTKSFFKYSATTGAFVSKVAGAATVNIGGHGSAIYHVFAQQKKRTDRAFKQATLRYQYGFATGLVENPNLIPAGATLPGWTIGPETIPTGQAVVLHPEGGVTLGCDGLNPDNNWIKPTSGIAAGAGEKYTIKVIFNNAGYVLGARAQVKLGSTYLKEDGSWTTTPHIMEMLNQKVNPDWHNPDIEPRPPRYVAAAIEKEWTINTESTNVSGTLNITCYEYAFDEAQEAPYRSGTVYYKRADILPAVEKEDQPLGEFYRADNPGNCTFIPEAKTVYNADDTSAIFVGTIYRADGVTPTLNWHRKGVSESKPLLSIAAENMLRMHQRPFTIYEGAVKGYFAPLSRFTVTGIDGALMMVAADYDTSEGIAKLLLIQIDNTPIAGAADVIIEYDYGQYGSSGSGSSSGGYLGGGSNAADYLTQAEGAELFYPLTGNPSGFLTALPAHTHTIANVTGLQTALDSKASSSHTHTIANVTGLQTALDGKVTGVPNDFIKNTSTLQASAQFHVAKARVTTELYIPATGLATGQKARIKFSNAAGSGGEAPPPPLTSVGFSQITGVWSDNASLAGAINGKVSTSSLSTAATASSVVQRTSAGYINAVFFNNSDPTIETSGLTAMNGEKGDGYIRKFSAAAVRSFLSLTNVENKSSSTIRGELTLANVTTALGYTPLNPSSTVDLTITNNSGVTTLSGFGVSVARSAAYFANNGGDLYLTAGSSGAYKSIIFRRSNDAGGTTSEMGRFGSDGVFNVVNKITSANIQASSALYIPSSGLAAGQKVRLKFKTS